METACIWKNIDHPEPLGEMHINTDLRFLLIPVTMAIEKQMNTSWEIPGWEEELLFTTGGSVSWTNCCENQCGDLSYIQL